MTFLTLLGCSGTLTGADGTADGGGVDGGTPGGGLPGLPSLPGLPGGGGGESDGGDAGGAVGAGDGGTTGGGDGGGTGTTDAGMDAGVSGNPFVFVGGANAIVTYKPNPVTGALGSPQSLNVTGNPTFLALRPGGRFLYAVLENADQVAAFSINPTTGALTQVGSPVSSGGNGPAHLSVDKSGKWVLVSNYGTGPGSPNSFIAVLPIQNDGSLGAVVDSAAPGVNAHQIDTSPDNGFAFVPCLGSDIIAQFRFDASTGQLDANATPTVATPNEPRHFAFHPTVKWVYGINEADDSMTVFDYDAANGRLSAKQTLSTLPAGVNGNGNTTAEVVVHPSGKFVYGSNRGHNSIVGYTVGADGSLTLVGHMQTGINTPRSFTVNPAGDLLYVGNLGGANTVTAYRIDGTTGVLTSLGLSVNVNGPSFVGWFVIPRP